MVAVLAFTVLALLPAKHLVGLPAFDWWDKAQHALAFAVLAALAWGGWPSVAAWRWGAGLVIYGVVIELAQAATGWRYGEVADAVADALGVAAGLSLVGLWRRGFSRRRPA